MNFNCHVNVKTHRLHGHLNFLTISKLFSSEGGSRTIIKISKAIVYLGKVATLRVRKKKGRRRVHDGRNSLSPYGDIKCWLLYWGLVR